MDYLVPECHNSKNAVYALGGSTLLTVVVELYACHHLFSWRRIVARVQQLRLYMEDLRGVMGYGVDHGGCVAIV